MKRLIHFFFILLFTNSAFAGECEPVDLDAKDGTLYEIPRYSQTLGTCYAHTVAAMYDSYRKKYNQPDLDHYSSPTDVAYQISKNKDTIEAGYINDINLLNDSPPCPTDSSVKFNRPKMDPLEEDYKNLQNNLRDLSSMKVKVDPKTKQPLNEESYSEKEQQELTKKYEQIVNKNFSCDTKKSSFLEVYDILAHMKVNEAAALGMNSRCEPNKRLKLDRPLLANATKVTDNSINLKTPTNEQLKIMRNINSEFDVYKNQSLPLGIAFCSTSLSRGPDFVFKANITNSERNTDCENHAVLVSGRRKNPKSGKCEFKIRNSWGHCGKVKSVYECNKKNGDTWMPEDVLERYLLGVSIIK